MIPEHFYFRILNKKLMKFFYKKSLMIFYQIVPKISRVEIFIWPLISLKEILQIFKNHKSCLTHNLWVVNHYLENILFEWMILFELLLFQLLIGRELYKRNTIINFGEFKNQTKYHRSFIKIKINFLQF